MFIDNLDQAALPVDEVISVISNELEDCDLTRLKLRLVCRDADWSDTLSDRLSRHTFEKDAALRVQTYHLLPLNDDEIRLAATKSGKSGDEFLQQLSDAQATPLARIPITLQMLLNADTLTVDRAKLFKSGLLQLRKATRSESKNSRRRVAMRLSAAAKIAGVMKLCDRYSIDIDGSATLNANSITVSELLRCLHDTMGELDEEVIHETLNSALFAGSGQRRWAHQSYADFLAASFLQEHAVPPNRMLEWTTGSDGKFAPQLRETLRWLCELDGTFVRNVAKRDMELLLASDLSHLSKRMYKQFIRQLLDGADDYEYALMSDAFRNMRAGHPDASAVLRPYLVDTELGNQKRVLVLRILDSVPTVEIEDSMLDIVLNKCEPQILRNRSARRLVKEGSKSVKLKLKRFVGSQEDDEDDQLKGYALQALWPENVTADELFDALQPPKCRNYFGSYALFISELKRSEFMNLDVIPAALEWVARQPRRHDMPFFFPDLMDIAMRAAWQYRHLPSVLESFAQAVVARLKHHDGIFGEKPYFYPPDQGHDAFMRAFAKDNEGRRELALLCLKLISDHDNAAALLRFSQPPLVTSKDTDWLVGLLDTGVDVDLRSHVCQMVARTAIDEPAKVYEASERHPDLLKLTEKRFVSMLDDPDTDARRDNHREWKALEADTTNVRPHPPPVDRIYQALDEFESGETWQWANVLHGLALHPQGEHVSWKLDPNICHLPSWNDCDGKTRKRIVDAAREYVLKHGYSAEQSNHRDLFAPNPTWLEIYGYLALFHLLHKDEQFISDLPTERWRRWASVIMWYPLYPMSMGSEKVSEVDRASQRQLVQCLQQAVPTKFYDIFSQQLNMAVEGDQQLDRTLDIAQTCWSAQIEHMLVQAAFGTQLAPSAQNQLLKFLLNRNSVDASKRAHDLVATASHDTDTAERVVLTAATLISLSDELNWTVIWDTILKRDYTGRQIVEKVATDFDRALKFPDKLNEQELTDLCMWLVRRYPTSAEVERSGSYAPSVEDQVGDLAGDVLSALHSKDSHAALRGLDRICNQFPELARAQQLRAHLKASLAGRDWKPASPDDVKALLDHREPRWRRWGNRASRIVAENWKLPAGIALREWLPF